MGRPVAAEDGGANPLGRILKVARPGFWLTAVWFYLLPLGRIPAWQQTDFWIGCCFVTFPLGLLIYGWNDLMDFENDRANPRKGTFLFGARLNRRQLAALPCWIAFVQAPFVVYFWFLFGWESLVWWLALLGVTALYNWPRIGFKNWPGVDMLNQAGYLLIFVLASWLNGVPQLPWFTFLFGGLFAMHSHLFGQIMDYLPDLRAGRRTTAGVLGVCGAKWLMAALLAGEAALLWHWAGERWLALALAGGALFFVADVVRFWGAQPYAGWQMRFFFLGWNAAALVSIPWVWSTATLRGAP